MIKESTHWYDGKGQPRYTIIGKNGKERSTTLRDAREHGYVPSVTSVMGIAAKPGLENWKIDQALLSALTLPREEGESLDSFMKRAKSDARQQGLEAAARGTEIHAYVEAGFSEGRQSEAFDSVFSALYNLTDLSDGWVAEDSFCAAEGFGGKIDLYHAAGIVVDFKTKDRLDKKEIKKLIYDEHGMQLSAYAHGLGFISPTRISVFIDRDDPSMVLTHLWENDTHQRHLGMFMALLSFWKLSKKYEPETNHGV